MPRKQTTRKSVPPEPTRPPWRPTKYRHEFCEMVVEAGELGYSLTAFAGQIKVDRATIARWMNEREDFRKACHTAKALRARWWEERLMEVGRHGGGPGQAPVAMFGVKNAAPDDWKDSTQIDHTSSDGSAAPSRVVIVAGEGEGDDQ